MVRVSADDPSGWRMEKIAEASLMKTIARLTIFVLGVVFSILGWILVEQMSEVRKSFEKVDLRLVDLSRSIGELRTSDAAARREIELRGAQMQRIETDIAELKRSIR